LDRTGKFKTGDVGFIYVLHDEARHAKFDRLWGSNPDLEVNSLTPPISNTTPHWPKQLEEEPHSLEDPGIQPYWMRTASAPDMPAPIL